MLHLQEWEHTGFTLRGPGEAAEARPADTERASERAGGRVPASAGRQLGHLPALGQTRSHYPTPSPPPPRPPDVTSPPRGVGPSARVRRGRAQEAPPIRRFRCDSRRCRGWGEAAPEV
ncbi:Hypothetical predicted protein [Marmota monax]|uniref:Uncharacterized protein n=1 Tax=Marmota monax TaxID=9995 RepID=A0A5E4A804_MARMO|nr:Hypothetical predicted protein [Marmota monax]